MPTRGLFYIILFLAGVPALAQSQLEFRSGSDSFTLDKQGRRFSLNGKAVDSETFAEFLPTLKQELTDPCENLPARPDLVLTLKENGQSQSKSFYIAQHMIKSGNTCLYAQGEGIYLLPLHRSWFDTEQKGHVELGDRLNVDLTDGTAIRLMKDDVGWASASSSFYPDVDFMNRFVDSLKDYKADVKAHLGACKDKLTFKAVSAGNSYQFCKVGTNLWAMKKPGAKWLEGSKSWSFWMDMVKAQWEDRFAAQVSLVLDKNNETSARIGALQNFKSSWSGSIGQALRKILLDREEKTDMKLEALKLLRQKPTSDNFKVMIQALGITEDRELLLSLTQALRVRNPKGPVIETDADEGAKAAAIRQWQSWWREQKNP